MVWFPALATDLAVLRNGNEIRHERHVVLGNVTRLFIGSDPNSYIEVPTNEIEHFEKDLSVPPRPPAPVKLAPTAPASVASSVTARSVTPSVKSGVATPPPMGPLAAPLKSAAPLKTDEAVNQSSSRYHIDPDLINSVIRAESGFNPHAVSPKGAQGLMQLMPKTAGDLGVKNAFEPGANVDGGTKYLRELLERYDFDMVKALAAYNAGPHRVEQYHGVPPYYETRAYVARIVRDFNRKKLAQQKAAAEAAKKAAATKTTNKVAATRTLQKIRPAPSLATAPGAQQQASR